MQAVTCALTLLEVLVVPFRLGNLPLAERYEVLLTRGRGVRLVEIGRPLLRAAARLRAAYPTVRTPDALQVASALAFGCTALVTNDRQMPDIAGLRVLQLRDYLELRRPRPPGARRR